CTYKTYVFAQPKPGNDHYAADFESRFSNGGLAFRVTNSLDWVPQVPFTLEFIGDINEPNLVSAWVNSSVRLIALKSLLDGTDSVFSGGQHILENHLRDRFEPALRQLVSPGAPLGAAARAALALMPSFNFVNAGSEYALIGTACAGAQCNDG